MQGEIIYSIKRLNKISYLVNPTINKNYHYTSILYGQTNSRLGKAKLHSLTILIDYGLSYSILLRKNLKTI